MALSCRHMIRTRAYRARTLVLFARTCSNSANKGADVGKENDVKHDQTDVESNNKAKNASRKLADLLSDLKVVKGNDKSSDLNFKLARPPDHKLSKKNNTLLALKEEEKERFSNIEQPLVNAIQSVASSIGGDAEKTESELIRALKSYQQETDKSKNNVDLSGLFSGMIIEKKKPREAQVKPREAPVKPREAQVPPHIFSRPDKRPQQQEKQISRRDRDTERLFGGRPLGIFKKVDKPTKDEPPSLWDICEEHELKNLRVASPANAFEQMIKWTEQGKLWKFPIDNEQGWEEERNVPFHEHIFLDRHLKDGFPQTGPIRHFMELVCLGLSKNPHMTVQRKVEHIQWYKDYFKGKEAVLQELEVVSQES